MNTTKQEKMLLKKIYNEAMKTIVNGYGGFEERQIANQNYAKFMQTMEETVQVFDPKFDLERDLKLVTRGLDTTTLRYVTSDRVSYEDKKEQLKFYGDRYKSL